MMVRVIKKNRRESPLSAYRTLLRYSALARRIFDQPIDRRIARAQVEGAELEEPFNLRSSEFNYIHGEAYGSHVITKRDVPRSRIALTSSLMTPRIRVRSLFAREIASNDRFGHRTGLSDLKFRPKILSHSCMRKNNVIPRKNKYL
jgi:hypothetical protein